MHALSIPLLSLLPLLAPPPEGWLGIYLAADRTEAVVAEVIPGSPAEKAGLQAGDVLLAVGDTATGTVDEFRAAIRAQAAGSRVSLKIRRQDKESTVQVKLGERPAEAGKVAVPGPATQGKGQPPQPSRPDVEKAAPQPGYLGIRVLETADGIVVGEVLDGSPAAHAGIQKGEHLVTIGERPVRTLAEVDPVLAGTRPGQRLTLGLRGQDGVRSVLVELGSRDAAGGLMPRHGHPAVPPAAPAEPAPPKARDHGDLEQQVQDLRAELQQLRKQLEELRRRTGRE